MGSVFDQNLCYNLINTMKLCSFFFFFNFSSQIILLMKLDVPWSMVKFSNEIKKTGETLAIEFIHRERERDQRQEY